MPGSFSKDNRPVRPGAYFNWETEQAETIAPSIGSVVCVPIVHDWGPDNMLVATTSFGDFQSKYGPSTDTPGYAAVKQCFKGEGVAGRGGAGEVLVYRMCSASAAMGSVDVLDDQAAPAITLTARYKGSYANSLGVRVQAKFNDPTITQLMITLSGNVIETHSHDASDLDGHAALINTQSKWVTATVISTTGNPLDTSTPLQITSLMGGNDGSDLLGADWEAATNAVSNARFSLFAPYDCTDPAILEAIRAWTQSLNSSGKRFMLVVGGGPDDAVADAIDRSTTLADIEGSGGGENIVNLGVGYLVDDELGNLSTSQLAPRIAGILAARGETMSLTYARLAGTSPGVLPSDADISACFDGGVVVFGQDSNADAPIRVEKGLTCYTGGDSAKPYLIYRNPKFVRVMHGIELDITEWAQSNAIGSLQVNDQTRSTIVGYGHTVMDARAGIGVIQDGYTVGVDPDPPPTADDEFVAVVYGIAFGRSVEQVYNTVYIS